jgi:hypothetical protein
MSGKGKSWKVAGAAEAWRRHLAEHGDDCPTCRPGPELSFNSLMTAAKERQKKAKGT